MVSEEQGGSAKAEGRGLSDVLRDNVRKYRTIRDLDQTKLAEAMQTFGFDWKQATVGFVEGGRRQVKVDELPALAIALQATIPELLDPSGPDKMNTELLLYSREPHRAMESTAASWWVRGRLRIGIVPGDKFRLRVTGSSRGEVGGAFTSDDPQLRNVVGEYGRLLLAGSD